MTQRPVRLKHAWQGWPAGHVFTDMPSNQADHMIAAGQAEFGDTETKGMEAPNNRQIGGRHGRGGRTTK